MEQLDCSICFETLDDNQVALECSHVFHFQCVKQWVVAQRKGRKPPFCPVCKFDINRQFTLQFISDVSEQRGTDPAPAPDDDDDDEAAASMSVRSDAAAASSRRLRRRHNMHRRRQPSEREQGQRAPNERVLSHQRVRPARRQRDVRVADDRAAALNLWYLNRLYAETEEPEVHRLVWQSGNCLAQQYHSTVPEHTCVCEDCSRLDVGERAQLCFYCHYFIHRPPSSRSVCALCPQKIARRLQAPAATLGVVLKFVWAFVLLIAVILTMVANPRPINRTLVTDVIPAPLWLVACVLIYMLPVKSFPEQQILSFVQFHLGFRSDSPHSLGSLTLTKYRWPLPTALGILLLVMTFLPFITSTTDVCTSALFPYRQAAFSLTGCVLASYAFYLRYSDVVTRKYVLHMKTLLHTIRSMYNAREVYQVINNDEIFNPYTIRQTWY